MATIERRIDALESRIGGDADIRLILVRLVSPGKIGALPSGIRAAPPYLPVVDRLDGETWSAFSDRLGAMVARHSRGTVVLAFSRNAEA